MCFIYGDLTQQYLIYAAHSVFFHRSVASSHIAWLRTTNSVVIVITNLVISQQSDVYMVAETESYHESANEIKLNFSYEKQGI